MVGPMTNADHRTWHHLILTTYGAWLYGDDRGFRTRHHREHVDGDYKQPPPPEMYAHRRQRSQESLKHAPVVMPPLWRAVIGDALRQRLEQLGAFVLCVSVSGQHAHILAKMPSGTARVWSGLAKAHAWHVARSQGWLEKLWARRGKAKPICSRQHQLNVYHYILAHAQDGAWVWKWRREQELE